MITVNLTIHPKYNLGDTVFIDLYDKIDKAVITDYMIKTYLLEWKTELEYAYQVESKKGKYTVDCTATFDTKEEALESIIDRRWKEYKGKTETEIAEIMKAKWNQNWNNSAAEVVKNIKQIIKKAWKNI